MTRQEVIDQVLDAIELLDTKLYAVDFPDEILIHIHSALRALSKARSALHAAKIAEDLNS